MEEHGVVRLEPHAAQERAVGRPKVHHVHAAAAVIGVTGADVGAGTEGALDGGDAVVAAGPAAERGPRAGERDGREIATAAAERGEGGWMAGGEEGGTEDPGRGGEAEGFGGGG